MVLSRRELLKSSACVVGFSLLGHAPFASAQQVGRGALPLDQADSFLALRPDGTVVVYSGKVDLGTGHRIAMRQMVGVSALSPSTRSMRATGTESSSPTICRMAMRWPVPRSTLPE